MAVIPAKAGIQSVRELGQLDSGSPLRFARNDAALFLMCRCHCVLASAFIMVITPCRFLFPDHYLPLWLARSGMVYTGTRTGDR